MSESAALNWLAQAVAAAEKADWPGAEALLGPHVRAQHPGALHLLGLVRRAQGQFEQAAELFEAALQAGGSEDLLLELARLAFETRDYAQARQAFKQALGVGLSLEDADWHRFAHALADGGEAKASLEIYLQLLQKYPAHAQLWMHMGNARLALGQTEAALNAFDKGLELDSAISLLYYNRARTLHMLGRFDEAEQAVNRSIMLDANLPAAWSLLGSIMQRCGRPEDARPAFERGLELAPDDALIWNNLGTCEQALYRAEQAEVAYRQALEFMPKLWEAQLNLAHLQRERGHSADALELMNGLLVDDPLLRYQMAFVLPVIQDQEHDQELWHQRLNDAITGLEAAPVPFDEPMSQIGRLPFYLPYLGVPERPILERLARVFEKACPILNWRAPHIQKVLNHERQPGPWRIGILSACFYQHTVWHLFGYLLPELTRQGFELTLLYTGQRQDDVTDLAREQANHFLHLPGDLLQARQQIAAQQLDLILSWDIGMEPLTYFLAFSRLAPIQMLTWGHPLTSGLSTQDYFLTSPGLSGPKGQSFFSERLLELPHFFAHWAHPGEFEAEAARADFGLPEGRLYLCPQSLYKLHPSYDSLLAGILDQDPEGKLVVLAGLYPEWRVRLEQRWAGKLDLERVIWLERVSAAEYIRLVGCGSVMLDTRPFGGGLTMLQALAQGVPVVTWPDESIKGRVTNGICLELDWMDGVVSSEQEYISRAIELAQNWGERERAELQVRYLENMQPKRMGSMVGAALLELCERRFNG